VEAEEAEPSTWRHKLIVPMLIELRALEWLDISGHLDGDIVTMLSVIKVLQVLSRRMHWQQNLLLPYSWLAFEESTFQATLRGCKKSTA
jgi:tRNA isopentenyl-2-thiomethyl-A-37 hydroxylase MiaE